MKVGIIGIGNIGSAISKGLSKVNGSSFIAYDRNQEKNIKASKYQGAIILDSSLGVIKSSDLIILCVRTEQASNWIKTYIEELKTKTLVLVQSGLSVRDLTDYKLSNIVRIITNVNVSENLGHTVFLQNNCDKFDQVLSIFNKLGSVLIVNSETELDRLSLITGCTPAISAMFSKGLEGCHNGSIDLLIDVVSNSLNVMKKQKSTPYEYANRTYSKGGMFEKCVIDIGENSEFQNKVINWLNPLKETLE